MKNIALIIVLVFTFGCVAAFAQTTEFTYQGSLRNTGTSANGNFEDIDFGAEDVAKIDPQFVTYNDIGEVEGVKYDRFSVAFVNAFKEQQVQIEAQQKTIESQQKQIDELRLIVCALNNAASICKENMK